MDEIVHQLVARFPLLTQLRLQARPSSNAEPFPMFLGLILSVMETQKFTSSCFVLPQKGITAPLMAVIHALQKFITEYLQLLETYAAKNFKQGQRVRVHPHKRVYLYDGICELHKDFIWLATVDKTGRQNFPLSNILRLEITNAQRPLGKLREVLKLKEMTALDQLLGVMTHGNQSLFSNSVLLLDYTTEFREFANNVYLQKSFPIIDMPLLGDLLPFGSIPESDRTGATKIEKWDRRNPTGEPLVGITSSMERLAAACHSARSHSKVVITNGLGLVTKNLQAYDEICQTQSLIMIAQHDEQDKMQVLADRGCKFWWLSEKEILMIGSETTTAIGNSGFFEPIFRAATNQAELKIETLVCEDIILDEIGRHLEDLNTFMKNDENDALKKLVRKLYGLLLQAAGLVQAPLPEECRQFFDRLSDIRRELARNTVWLDKSASDKIVLICDLLEKALSAPTQLGEEKGRQLIQVLQELEAKNSIHVAILTRKDDQIEKLKVWMKQVGKELPIFSPSHVPDDAFFDCIIAVTWPGGEAFQKFVRRYSAPHIKVIGYSFENRWLRQCQKRIRRLPDLPTLSREEKTELLRLDPNIKLVWPEALKSDDEVYAPEWSNDFSIWDFEQRFKSARKGGMTVLPEGEETIPAKYASFVGDSFAYLTESHKVPIVTGLLASNKTAQHQIPLRKVDEMKAGDFVVFKDGGSKDVIHAIADLMMGEKASTLRQLAGMWRRALLACIFTPERLHAQVVRAGGTHNLVTIRNWLYDDYHIGPGKKDDLDLIARVTGSSELKESQGEIWNAIESIRSAHLSAGMRLKKVLLHKLPEHLDAIKEEGTRINVDDLVAAWVVQVESIGSEFEPYFKLKVNELQWDESAAPANWFS